MKLSIIAIFLASFSLSTAYNIPGSCYGQPNRPQGPWPARLKLPKLPPSNKKPPTPKFELHPIPRITISKRSTPILRRGPDLHEYTTHYPRNAVLETRGYYDDDRDLGSLYARDSELDDWLLHRRDVEEDDLLDLEIRDLDEEYVTLIVNGNGRSSSSRAGGPHLPAGLDSSEDHMFFRLNAIPKAYPPVGSVDHAGLNKLLTDLAGQHIDVVYGDPSKGYRECGLILVDMAWTKTHPNADGYPVVAQCRELLLGEKDKYTYVGQYSGGSVENLCKSAHLIPALVAVVIKDC